MRALSCEEVTRRLPALIVGDLSGSEIAEMDAHASDCPECCADIRQSRGLSRALGALAAPEHVDGQIERNMPVLRDRLTAALPRRVDIDRIDSPLGPITIAVTTSGLAAIHYGGDDASIIPWLQRAGLDPSNNPVPVRPVVRQLREYFAGERQQFDLPIDLALASPFTRAVLQATTQIPYGHLASYRDIARAIDRPGATRAVGNALGHNPVPIVIPCHRVVRSDGSLGGYTGGLAIKRHLLELEGRLLPI